MPFDLSNAHVVYVLAAYAVAGVFMGILTLCTVIDYRKTRKK